MNRKLILGLLCMFAAIGQIGSATAYTNNANLEVSMVNQQPSYANPGDTVDLLFKVENTGFTETENTSVTLKTEYPFSLRSGESATKNLGSIEAYSTGDDAYLVRYTVKVDEQVTEGEKEIKLQYSPDSDLFRVTKTFDISVADTSTDIDVTAKQVTENVLTLQANNVGDNKASSTTVEIPEQRGLEVKGSNSQVIGGLEAGENSEVKFPISNAESGETMTVKVHYTDENGVRRTEEKTLVIPEISIQPVDITLQSTSDSSTTFGIVNTGTNPIYATVVKLQSTTSTQVIGNLGAGDYTLASFETSSASPKVTVTYTDTLGVRRTTTETLTTQEASGNTAQDNMTQQGPPENMSSGERPDFSGEMPQGAGNFQNQASSNTGSGNQIYIIVGLLGLVGIAGFFGYRKYRRKKQKAEKE